MNHRLLVCSIALLSLCGAVPPVLAQTTGTAVPVVSPGAARFVEPVAFDLSPPLRQLSRAPLGAARIDPQAVPVEVRPERGAVGSNGPFRADPALQSSAASRAQALAIAATKANFDGLANADNAAVLGFIVNPPDPVGAVGPSHYVQMVNLVYAVFDKQGNRLVGPASLGSLWAGFPVTDCAHQSGDPIVLYDQLEDRWLLTQFTSAGPIFYNCVAVSQTGDPTGAYFRYAFSAGEFFPDYPKYGVWTDSYVLTTREFGPTVEYRIGVYALEKRRMIVGDPKARMLAFYLDSAVVPIALIGDGLLPATIDGTRRPSEFASIPIVGTQDDGGPYGATFDALNIYNLDVKWRSTPIASLTLATQLPVASFDSIFPCAPGSRDCLPQPGVTDPARYLDILSYRQRPTWRLAYRNFGDHEALVTAQSVEALPGVAGMRWYEIRRSAGSYSVYQQGTYAPNDGVHRWMGSVAMDRKGNIALGFSVVNGVDVFPGIRYTGRLAGDPLGQMTLGEGVVINGSGVQTTTNSRWGDYTSLNVDPTDDCTFWYVNEYYAVTGLAPWRTRIASFGLPGCAP